MNATATEYYSMHKDNTADARYRNRTLQHKDNTADGRYSCTALQSTDTGNGTTATEHYSIKITPSLDVTAAQHCSPRTPVIVLLLQSIAAQVLSVIHFFIHVNHV